MQYTFKYSLTVISRRKRNFILTAFVVALGISLVVQTQILEGTIERNYKEVMIESFGNTDILIISIDQIYFPQNISDKLIQELNTEVEAIFPQITYPITAYYAEKGQFEQGVILETIGSDFDRSFWGNLYSNTSGVELNISSLASDEIIISPELANSLNATIGAQIRINLFDEYGNPIFHNVTVVDIYSYHEYGRTGDPGDFRRIFMSETAVQSLIPTSLDNPITRIIVGIEEHEDNTFLGREKSDEAKSLIIESLNSNFPDYLLGVSTIREDSREGLEASLSSFASIFQMFGVVVVIAGLLLITNIQLMNMEEREQQIGMLRAIGAKKREIFFAYSLETVLIGVLGGFFGLLLGIIVGIWLNGLSRNMLSAMGNPEISQSIFDIVVQPETLIISLIAAITLSVVTGMVPALRARGISIIEIVRGSKSQTHLKLINGKKPIWPFLLGGFFLILGSITLIDLVQAGQSFYSAEGFRDIEQEAAQNFQALFYVGLGLLFLSFRLDRHRRAGLTVGGFLLIALTIWGFQVAIDWATEGGNANNIAMTGLLSAVIGATTVVGTNLETLTSGLRKCFALFKRTRATGLVATRYINARKSRAVLTFATFAVILSLNFFIGSYAETQITGSSHTWEYYMSGVSLVVESQTPLNLSSVDYPEILLNQFEEIKQVFPLDVGMILPFEGAISEISPEEDIFYTKLVALNCSTYINGNDEVLYPFTFDDLLANFSQLSMINRLQSREAAREESKEFWEVFIRGQKVHRLTKEPVDAGDPNGLPIFLGERLYFLDIGDIVSFPAANGSLIEMIYGGALNYFPSFDMRINDYPLGIIVSTDFAAQFSILGYGTREFLIESIAGYDYEKNKALSGKIEEFSNSNSPDSLITLGDGTFYGITAHHLWDVFYNAYSANASALNFLQTFIATGLFIGIIGLLVVSHRSVKERKREIGMLRSLGFSKKAVSLAVLLELLFLGILGYLVGFFTGNYLAWVFADLVNWKLTIPWTQVSLYGVFILGSVMIAALIPGWLAARIPPSEALRYHG